MSHFGNLWRGNIHCTMHLIFFSGETLIIYIMQHRYNNIIAVLYLACSRSQVPEVCCDWQFFLEGDDNERVFSSTHLSGPFPQAISKCLLFKVSIPFTFTNLGNDTIIVNVIIVLRFELHCKLLNLWFYVFFGSPIYFQVW